MARNSRRPAALSRVLRRRDIAGGQGRDSQHVVSGARFEPTKLDGGLDGLVGGGPGRRDVTLVREDDTPAHEAIHPPDLIVSCLGLVGHRGELCYPPADRLDLFVRLRGTSGTGALEPVTDRVGEIASLLGGRTGRDRVTRRESHHDLRDEDLAEPPPVARIPGQAARLGQYARADSALK